MKQIAAIILIAALIIGVLFLVAGMSEGNSGIINTGDNTYRTTCQITIANPILRSSRIDSYTCTTQKTSFCIGSLSALGLFSDAGNLYMAIGGKTVTSSWSCGEGKFCDVDISVCHPDAGTGTLKLRDKDNQVLDEKQLTLK